MVSSLIRFFKRVGVLIPGLLMAYIAVHDVFPALKKYLPSNALAILVTYVITAYVLIPSLLRLIRLIFKTRHIPLYCTTPDGFASDPVNIGIVGTKDELITAMTNAGWYSADKRTPRTLLKMASAMVLSRPYKTAPFSKLYLFGRSQDLGFEIPLDINPRHRHHVRFWAASYTDDPEHLKHISFWRGFHRSNIVSGRILWVGAASLDTGIGIIRHNAQLTHRIHYDTDSERDLIAKQLQKTNHVKRLRTVNLGQPYKLRNRVIRGYMKADGKMAILELIRTYEKQTKS